MRHMPCLARAKAIGPAPLAGDFGSRQSAIDCRPGGSLHQMDLHRGNRVAADRSNPSGFIVVGRMKKAAT
jgi:hypothetical protein